MDEDRQAQKPELKRPEEDVEDLEPREQDSEGVTGGAFIKTVDIKPPS